MSNNIAVLDPIIVTPHDNPAPIMIGGKPYYPGPSFGVSYDLPAHIIMKPVNLKLGGVGLVNFAEFSIKIRDINNVITQYNASLSKSEINQLILEAKNWLDKYALDFENSREVEVYIMVLEESLRILENTEKSIVLLQNEAEKQFNELLSNNIVRLSNFKKFKDSKPELISVAYESNIAYFRSSKMTKEYVRLWKEKIEVPQIKVLVEKQKMEASLRSLLNAQQELRGALNDLDEKMKNNNLQTNAEYIVSFFEHITEKYGDLASKEAKKLAEISKGKKIRNVEDALTAFNKYKDVINKKFSVKDREAIAKALQSLDLKSMSEELYKFHKAFKYGGNALAGLSLLTKIKQSIETGDWKPFYVEAEKIALDRIATGVVAFSLVLLTGTPLGVLGYAILMVAISALISDELVEEVHEILFE